MGMCGGGGGYANSTTSNQPWDVQGDYLRELFKPGVAAMTGYTREGMPVGSNRQIANAYKGVDEFGNNIPGRMEYIGDKNNMWGGEGLQALENTNKGLGETLQMSAAPTVAGFSPEELAAQNIIKARLQGYNTATTNGNTYKTGYTDLIPQAKTALGNIVQGNTDVNPASYSAANISAPSTISTPSVRTPDSYQAPNIGSTDLGYKYWDELGSMAGGKRNPYLEDLITNARSNITNEFYNNTMPALDTTAEQAGRYGTNTWANMRGSAYDKYQNSLKAQETALRGEAYNTNQANALNAMNLGGNLATTQSGYDYGQNLNQAQLENQRRATEYGTNADVNKLQAQLGLQANTAQSGNELQRNTGNAGFQQEANQGNAAFQQQANMQNIANILQSTGMAPNLAQSDYNDIAKLAAVGESQGAKQQDIIDAFVNRFNFNQTEPMQRLGFASNILSGDLGGTTNSVAPSASGGCF